MIKEQLSNEKFLEIYLSEKFRNEVADAHGCVTSSGVFKYYATCGFPSSYIVNPEQIQIAKAERERAKAETIKKNKGKLLFVGMGMTYDPRYEQDVCNHRVRGYFENPKGERFFIEFTRVDNRELRYAIDHAQKEKQLADGTWATELMNYKNLERLSYGKKPEGSYSLPVLMGTVNSMFECHFTEIVIDNYNVGPDEFVSVSPKPAK